MLLGHHASPSTAARGTPRKCAPATRHTSRSTCPERCSTWVTATPRRGDGEVSGVAVEIPSQGTITVDLVKGQAIATPRVENSEYLMVVGNARPMEDAARIAFHEMVRWLEKDFEIDQLSAYQLCSQVAKVRLANVVDILYTIVAKFPKEFLPPPRGREPALGPPSKAI